LLYCLSCRARDYSCAFCGNPRFHTHTHALSIIITVLSSSFRRASRSRRAAPGNRINSKESITTGGGRQFLLSELGSAVSSGARDRFRPNQQRTISRALGDSILPTAFLATSVSTSSGLRPFGASNTETSLLIASKSGEMEKVRGGGVSSFSPSTVSSQSGVLMVGANFRVRS
jgi:hypothetical protein